MAVMNFGMDLRPTSQVIKTDDELAKESAARIAALQAQQIAAKQQRSDAAAAYGQARMTAAREAGYAVGDDYADIVRSVGEQFGGANAPQLGSAFSFASEQPALNGLRSADSAFNDITRQLSAAPGVLSQSLQARQTAQQTQQNAYNTDTLAGGQQGGVLSGIAQQGTLDPTQMASWGTPWTQPGFGNPGSLGGLGGYGGKTSQPQQNSGWGGVFGNRNPWSAA